MTRFLAFLLLASAALAQTDPEVSRLTAVLRDPASDTLAQQSACRALGRMGPRAKSAVPSIIPILKSPDRDTRDFAITALYRIGPDSRPALPALRQLASHDPDEILRSLAQHAIEVISGTAQQLPPATTTPPLMPPSAPLSSPSVQTLQTPGSQGRAALLQAIRQVGARFDAPPRLFRGVETVDGRNAQALFTATSSGRPLRGFAVAEGAQVKVVYDSADRFARTMQAMHSQSGGSGPVRRPARLYPTRFADGSGSILLPEGWRVTSTRNGAVTAEGPGGGLEFGYAFQCYTPNFPNNTPFRPPCIGPYGDPVRLLASEGMPQVINNFQLIERAPAPGWTNGVAEYLHFRCNYLGQPAEIFALAIEAMTSPYQFMLYYSQIRTPPGQFASSLPTLLEVWKSWKTDDSVFRKRLEDAANNMQSITRIIREANAYRQDAMERSSMAWDYVIRGTWPIEDTRTGGRYEAYEDYEPLLRGLNNAEGYERWRAVPYNQLNR